MNEHYFQLDHHDPEFLRARWDRLTSQYAPSQSLVEELFNSIVENYSAPDRAYHKLSHIQSLLSLSESITDKIQNIDAFCFSIWFHDVIYDPKRQDNEEKSAEFAAGALTRLGVPEHIVVIVHEMILATKHHRVENVSWDMRAFLDLDTSILGAPEEIYNEYSKAIRKECSWVPDFLFRKGRVKVLNDFLERDRIYYTEEFMTEYERQARQNIEAEITVLSE